MHYLLKSWIFCYASKQLLSYLVCSLYSTEGDKGLRVKLEFSVGSEMIFSWTGIRWCAGSNPKLTFDLDPLLHLALRPGSEFRRQAKGLSHIPKNILLNDGIATFNATINHQHSNSLWWKLIRVWLDWSIILLDLPLYLGELFCILWFLSFQSAEDYTEAVDIKWH